MIKMDHLLWGSQNDNSYILASNPKYVITSTQVWCKSYVVNRLYYGVDGFSFRPAMRILIVLEEKHFSPTGYICIITSNCKVESNQKNTNNRIPR